MTLRKIEKRELRGIVGAVVAAIVLVFALGGCTLADVAEKAAGLAVAPVFGLVGSDAKAANALIDVEVAAGRLPDAEAAELRLCPNAVLALSDIRKEVAGDSEDVDGFKGVIYHAVKARLRQRLYTDIGQHIQTLVTRCGELLPVDRLVRFF